MNRFIFAIYKTMQLVNNAKLERALKKVENNMPRCEGQMGIARGPSGDAVNSGQ
jgi:hypothetical protein